MTNFCQPFSDRIAQDQQRIVEIQQELNDPSITSEPGEKKKLETALSVAEQTLGNDQNYLRMCQSIDSDLTGTWNTGGYGTYYIRQIGTDVWWVGLSHDAGDSNTNVGLLSTNVFHGSRNGDNVTGNWADVPRGQTSNSGTLTFVRTDSFTFQVQAQTGGFYEEGQLLTKVV